MLKKTVLYFGLLCPALFGQTAIITGRVTDSSEAVIPAVLIKLQSVETGVETTTTSNASGYYTMVSLPPGKYNLSVNKPGFKPVHQTDLNLVVQQMARVDVVLQVGAVNETVEVTARPVLLDSESQTLGQLVQGRQITELPLLGRNPYALAGLVPGVRTAAKMNGLPTDLLNTSFASINGQRGNANAYLLDGAPNTASSYNEPVIYPNVDSVQEFKVETNNFSAEYGRAAGGVFNVVSKAGSNALHFTLYEFLRNDKLNANDFFANRSGVGRAPLRLNQFGGTVGAAIKPNKTFVFVTAELVRFLEGVTYQATVPTAQLLSGDFSGRAIIYDPLTTASNGSGGFVRTAFPGNMIPAGRIDPVARNMSKFWPAPTTGALNNNFLRTGSNDTRKNTFGVRLDHHFSDRDRIFGRFSYDNTPFDRAAAYGKEFVASPNAGPQTFDRRNSVIEETHIFSPTLLGVFRASLARVQNLRRPYSDGFDITQLGFPAGLAKAIGDPYSFPTTIITGYSVASSISSNIIGGALGANDAIRWGLNNYAFQAQFDKTVSSHNIKFGGEYQIIQTNASTHGDTATQFSFTNAFTQGPNPTVAGAGNALASFLLGIGAGSVAPTPSLAMTNTYYGVYVQDSWKVTPRLTVNLGLRYDFESPRTERYNQLTNFDSTLAPPLKAAGLDLHGALTFVAVNGASRYNADPDRNNFAPRAGIAFQINSKTLVRAGGGFFFGANTGFNATPTSFGISGFLATTTVTTSIDGVTPLNYLRNPYPEGLNAATGSSLGAATLLGQSVGYFDRHNRTPYSEQWHFSVQRELPGKLLLEAGYSGSRGLKFYQNLIANQLPDSALALKDQLRQLVPNPFLGQVRVGLLSQATISRAQLLRPYPQFDVVTNFNANWASSNYHGLVAKIERRYANGFTVLGSYSFSKLIDYDRGNFSGEALPTVVLQNFNNFRPDRAVSIIDQPHRFVVNTIYEIPLGKSLHGVAGKLVRGWEISGIYSRFSGGPVGVTSATNNTNSQGGNSRPNWTGVNPKISNPTPDHWFDTSQFSAAAAYAFGNAPRTFGGVRSDGTAQLDFSIIKNTKITEHTLLQFRAESFNLTNTVRFAPPNGALGNNLFGVTSAQDNQPRILQFALKIVH